MELNFILEKLKKKDKKTFQQVFEAFYPRLVNYSYKFTYNQAASEDLVQESFIYIWENIHNLKIEKSFQAYLFTMVRNRSLNYLKKIKVTDSNQLIDISNLLTENFQEEIFSELEKRRLLEKSEEILKCLPEKMQEIFKLKIMHGLSYKEISEEIGVSVNTVKTQLKRARLKIESALLILSYILFFY
ncbi:RNA polymerase sigma-70 factor, ECF subfamily [Salegentibacter echinorum]|uniref:RNA polymerase sigma-70 factor, ECF subfamily n=1 Tax=Salegentibacter echinorum TaxID=1073325 RepID=A0A1M5HID5_SALEC|nr:RNA polymerase sigma-70 factor [Salegentibacter echinorum]SHG15661.1 RNA polymerase sigma-70 factor, ECF subfamily [Salegentibacter echinorum]